MWVGPSKRLSGTLPIKQMGDHWTLRASQLDASLELSPHWSRVVGTWNLVFLGFAGLSPPSWEPLPQPLILSFPGDQQAMGEASF